MNKKTDKVIQDLKQVTLPEGEKALLKLSLFEKIKKSESKIATPFSQFAFASLYSSRFVLVPILICIFLGGGVAFAAEDSLPGSVLYPVKIYINEPVTRVFHQDTKEKKVDFEIELVEERLREAEKLSDSNKLDPVLHEKVKKNVVEQVVRAADVKNTPEAKESVDIKKEENKGQDKKSELDNKKEEVREEKKREKDDLEQVIQKHQKIIEKLGIKPEDTGKKGKK